MLNKEEFIAKTIESINAFDNIINNGKTTDKCIVVVAHIFSSRLGLSEGYATTITCDKDGCAEFCHFTDAKNVHPFTIGEAKKASEAKLIGANGKSVKCFYELVDVKTWAKLRKAEDEKILNMLTKNA